MRIIRVETVLCLFLCLVLTGCAERLELGSAELTPSPGKSPETQDTRALEDDLGEFYSAVRRVDKNAILLPPELGYFADWTYHEDFIVFSDFSTGLDAPKPDVFRIYTITRKGVRTLRVEGKPYRNYDSAFQSVASEQVFVRVLGGEIETILYDYQNELVLEEIRGYVLGMLPDGNILYTDVRSDELVLLDASTRETSIVSINVKNSAHFLSSARGLVMDPAKESFAFIATSQDESRNETFEIITMDLMSSSQSSYQG